MCKIAVISFHTSPLALPGTRDSGGMNVYVRELARYLGEDGHHLDIFTRQESPQSSPVERIGATVRLIRVPAGPWQAQKDELYQYLPQFVRGITQFAQEEREPYQLIHSHYWLSGWAGQMLKARWGIPHIIMFHTLGEVKRMSAGGHEPRHRLEAERSIAQEADYVICSTQQEAEILHRLYEVARHRLQVIPCGADTELFRPLEQQEARRQLSLPSDKFIVLFVGRLEPIKGLDWLLKALRLLPSRAVLVIVGGDERDQGARDRILSLARALGIEDRLTLRPAIPHEQLPLWYNAADVCAIPSRHESFGMVAIEAMACGIPVVASRVGGLQETVAHGETGYLVWPPGPEGLAHYIGILLANASLRQSMGKAAARRAQAYRWQKVAAQVEALYRRVLGPHRFAFSHNWR